MIRTRARVGIGTGIMDRIGTSVRIGVELGLGLRSGLGSGIEFKDQA